MNATNGKVNGELEQQLFELVYGLLEPSEAQALRRRVTSEPEVARAYARVVQQSERLALAASRPFRALLPKSVRPIAAADVAQAMVDAALADAPPALLESAAMQGAARNQVTD